MTPACCNCLYYHERYAECGNPDSDHYEHYRKPFRICDKWEYEKQFETGDKRDKRNGKVQDIS